MSFFGSIFGGQNKTLSGDMNKFGQIGEFATGTGMSDITKGSGFFSDILSGDKTKQARALASPISTIGKQTQQRLNTNAQFSPRSGGTAASNEMAKTAATGSINEMIASLLKDSARSLSTEGSNLLSQGQSAFGNELEASQIQMKNWSDSILGMGLAQGAGFAEGFGLGKIPGVPKGA